MNEFWSKFKWYLIGAGCLLLVAIAVTVGVLVANSNEGPVVAAPERTAAPGEEVPRVEKVESQEFEGQGSKKQTFKAGGGLTVFTLTHEGSQNFVVQYGSGDSQSLLVNEIGNFEGSKAVGLPVGDYTLDIATRGRWSVKIDQSVPTEAPLPPKKLEGTGAAASDFFSLKAGPARFRLTYNGSSLFAPQLINAADGTVITLLANELSDFRGEKTVEIFADGIYLVDVTAGGPWTIDVSQ
ncbi:MAG TPA: hypothetical protein VHI31_08015 [Actinomycetota bacterium]|nr:hypothetical protein [Actinomycetota bacterium]